MSKITSRVTRRAAKKAARVTAKHAVHGTVSETRRSPFHTAALLAAGTVIGATGAWFAARTRNSPALPSGPPSPGA